MRGNTARFLRSQRGKYRTLALLPGAVAADQIGAGSLAGSRGELLTFTRASTKVVNTARDYSAVGTVASGHPAVAPQGLLIEAAHLNYHLHSQDLDNAAWTKRGGVTVTANAILAPDGTMTGCQVNGLNSFGVDIFYPNIGNIPAGSVTPSFWLYPLAAAGALHAGSSTANPGSLSVDLTLLAPSKWVRLYVGHPAVTLNSAFTSNGSSGNGLLFRADSGGPLTAGIWGVGMGAGSSLLSYVPTTNVAATCNADVVTLPATNVPVARGSVELDFVPLWSTAASGQHFLVSTVQASTEHSGIELLVQTDNSVNLRTRSVSALTQTVSSALSWTAGQKYHFRAVWGSGNVYLYRDGVLVASNTSGTAIMPDAANAVSLGFSPFDNGAQADGYISNLKFYRH